MSTPTPLEDFETILKMAKDISQFWAGPFNEAIARASRIRAILEEDERKTARIAELERLLGNCPP